MSVLDFSRGELINHPDRDRIESTFSSFLRDFEDSADLLFDELNSIDDAAADGISDSSYDLGTHIDELKEISAIIDSTLWGEGISNEIENRLNEMDDKLQNVICNLSLLKESVDKNLDKIETNTEIKEEIQELLATEGNLILKYYFGG